MWTQEGNPILYHISYWMSISKKIIYMLPAQAVLIFQHITKQVVISFNDKLAPDDLGRKWRTFPLILYNYFFLFWMLPIQKHAYNICNF